MQVLPPHSSTHTPVAVSQVEPSAHSLPARVQSGSHSLVPSLHFSPVVQLVAVQGATQVFASVSQTSGEVQSKSVVQPRLSGARHALVAMSQVSPEVVQSSSVSHDSSQAPRSG